MDRWACRGLALLASPGCSGSPDANSRLGRRCFRRRLKYHMTGGSLPLCHNSWIIWTPTNSTIAIPVHTNVDDIVDIIVVKAPSAPLMPGRFYLLNKGVDNYGKTGLFFFPQTFAGMSYWQLAMPCFSHLAQLGRSDRRHSDTLPLEAFCEAHSSG